MCRKYLSLVIFSLVPISGVRGDIRGVHDHVALVILLGLDFMMSLGACYKSDGSNFSGGQYKTCTADCGPRTADWV